MMNSNHDVYNKPKLRHDKHESEKHEKSGSDKRRNNQNVYKKAKPPTGDR